jgi:Na+-translocating ferredoxin:NAD+ oxidoreductase subunit E
MNLLQEFSKGIIKENPVLRILLGMCATLAVTTSLINGIGMGLATTFVLVFSNLLVSLVAPITPDKIRIPVFVIVIATFTTVVDLLMAAYTPQLSSALGVFIPLIVVNCIIFGRAEAFACKAKILNSVIDGLGMGLGFILTLSVVSSIREIIGNGTILGFSVLGQNYSPALIMIMPPGAFLVLGLLIGTMNLVEDMRKKNPSAS